MPKSLHLCIILLFLSLVIHAQNNQLELEWAHSFSSERWDAITSTRADNSGNVVVAGFFSDALDFDPGPGELILTPGGDNNQSEFGNVNGFLQKLDNDGNVLWALKHLEGNFPSCCVVVEQKTSVYIAPNDEIFVLSNVNNSIDLDPGPELVTFGEAITQEWVIQKFSPNGELLWIKSTNLTENNGKATALSIDNNGDIFLGGVYNGFYCPNLGIGCSAVAPIYSSGDLPFISKLNGETGELLWVRTFEGISQIIDQRTIDADLLDIAVDQTTGNASIGGWFIGSLEHTPGMFWNAIGNYEGQRGYIITLNGENGETIWAKDFTGEPQFDHYVQDIAYDGNSRLFGRGRFPSEINFGFNNCTQILDAQGDLIHIIYQDPSATRERNTILHVNDDGSCLLSGMLSDDAYGRTRHKANYYNSSWELEVEHLFTGPFYIYSFHWANATMNENGEVFFAGGYSQTDYDADASDNSEFILPIGNCSYTVCSEAFVQKVSQCPGSNTIENISICSGSSYTFPDGTTIENIESDFSYQSIIGIINNCENTVTTNISVQESYFISSDHFVCSGELFTFPDGSQQTITENLTQTLSYQSISACDSIIVTNVVVEIAPSLSTSYDCVNNQILVDISDMGTYQGQVSPPWVMTALSNPPYESITIEAPGTYSFSNANPNQSHRLALFEPNNCAPDYTVFPNCLDIPCGESALEQVANGTFDVESDNFWIQTSTLLDGTTETGYDVIDATFIFDNSPLSAWFGGFNSGSITTIERDIYLPLSTEPAEFSWWQRYAGPCEAEDVFTISLDEQVIYSQNSSEEMTCGNPNWHKKTIDVSAFSTGSTYHLSISYTQTGINGFSSLFVDNVSLLSCPCLPNMENQTIQICSGDTHTFPNGITIENITEPFVQYSYFTPPPCLTGVITTVEIIPSGCTDPLACNFDALAICDDGSCCSCESDFNGDGTSNSSDLIILIEAYGCTSNCGPSDLNNDGVVSSADVILFLNNFGTSCL